MSVGSVLEWQEVGVDEGSSDGEGERVRQECPRCRAIVDGCCCWCVSFIVSVGLRLAFQQLLPEI